MELDPLYTPSKPNLTSRPVQRRPTQVYDAVDAAQQAGTPRPAGAKFSTCTERRSTRDRGAPGAGALREPEDRHDEAARTVAGGARHSPISASTYTMPQARWDVYGRARWSRGGDHRRAGVDSTGRRTAPRRAARHRRTDRGMTRDHRDGNMNLRRGCTAAALRWSLDGVGLAGSAPPARGLIMRPHRSAVTAAISGDRRRREATVPNAAQLGDRGPGTSTGSARGRRMS